MSPLYNSPSAIARAFPPPEYLTMPAVGIDISDYAIKYALLKQKNKRVQLTAHGKLDVPLDTVERGEIKDPATFTKILRQLKEDNGFRYVHLSLPEEHAYLFTMELPQASKPEMHQMVEFHLKENVPIGADEALIDYSILRENKEKYELIVSVYPMATAAGYITVFQEAGLTPLSLEIEGQATARALIGPEQKRPILIVDLGRNEASLSISTGRVVTFTANLETGGDVFTRAIARKLDVSFQEAEKLKRMHGFKNTEQSQPVYAGLQPVVVELKEAINKHLMYWRMHADVVAGSDEAIDQVVLAGGAASIIGLPEFLEAGLDIPVEIGNVWKNVFSFDKHVPEIHAAQSLEYATAVGLALRNLIRSK